MLWPKLVSTKEERGGNSGTPKRRDRVKKVG